MAKHQGNKEAKKQKPADAYTPVISARVHYKTKLALMEKAYSHQFSPNQYTGMIIEKVENECGGLEELNRLIENAKTLEGVQEALEKERAAREEAEKRAGRLDKEKAKSSESANKSSQEAKKKDEELKKAKKELEDLKEELKETKAKKKQMEGRLEAAKKWAQEWHNAPFFGGPDEPPKNGW